jgi:hypothetical protein
VLLLIVCSSQADLVQLMQPFGAVSKTVMLRAKNQVGSFSSLLAGVCVSEQLSRRDVEIGCFGGAGSSPDARHSLLRERLAVLQ